MRLFRFLYKHGLFLLILTIISGWLFFGWPNIFNFPPEISKTQAAISFVNCGTAVAVGSGNMASVGIPAGIQNNDILVAYIHTRDNNDSSMPVDWTNNTQGNGNTTNRLELFWKRTTGTESDPTITHSAGDSSIAQICAFRGAIVSGDPFNALGSVQSNSGSPISTSAITTANDGNMILHIFGSQDNNNWGSYTGTASTEASLNRNTVGSDNSLGITYGVQASAGSTGVAEATQIQFGPDAGVSVQVALKPAPTTVLDDGIDPANSTIAPGGSVTDLDSFTLNTTAGADIVTAATVSLSVGSFGGISLVSITSNGGSTVYCSQTPSADTTSISGCGIPITTTQTQFKVRITPKAHADMPFPQGSTYSITGTITAFTSVNTQSGTDMDSATVSIDNQSPANVTSASGSAGNQQVNLTWVNPADSDFHSVVVLRSSSGAISDVPVEGSTYTIGNTVGASTIACVETSPSTSCSDTGLTNDTAYHYKIFSKDNYSNYATGAVPTGSPFTPAVPPDTTPPSAISNLAASNATVNTIDLSWTSPGDDGSTGTATTYDARYSTSTITEGNFSSATQASGEPAPQIAGTSQSMTVNGLSSNTTYYFALKTSDESLNTSAISNVVNLATLPAPDTTAPAAVSNLETSSPTVNSLNLSWTSPGDDNNIGTATGYDLRYSTSVITADNFNSASTVTGEPTPSIAGTLETMTVSGLLSSATYYFAIKTSDEVPNTSTISNIASGTTATPPDTTTPAAISSLATSNATNDSIDISWTSPGDDNNTGTASSYDLRYSTSAITSGNFDSATQVTGEPAPQIAGASQSMTVSGLSALTTYYFAIKTSDEVPNTSLISNIPSGTTTATPDTTAPAAVSDLTASNATNNSIDVSWTAPGDDGGTGTATSYDLRYSTSLITASNFASSTQVASEPTPSVAGSMEEMTITGLSANTTYYFALKTSDEVPNTSTISNSPSLATVSISVPAPAPSSGGTGGVTLRKVTFAGQAYPKSKIDIFHKSLDASFVQSLQISNTVNDAGVFNASYTGLASGKYLFTLRAIDKDSRATSILPFNITLDGTMVEIKDILFPPTLGFLKSLIAKNDTMKVMGYAVPSYMVKLEVDGSEFKNAKADSTGFWNFDVDTTYLSYGDHNVRISQTSPDGKSKNFSLTRTFKIARLPVSKADMNGDSAVNINDWSIFLFQWGSAKEDIKLKNDLNGDGKVNIFDLSIFLQIIKF